MARVLVMLRVTPCFVFDSSSLFLLANSSFSDCSFMINLFVSFYASLYASGLNQGVFVGRSSRSSGLTFVAY